MKRLLLALLLSLLLPATAHAHTSVVYIESFWRAADGADWSPAFARAQNSVTRTTALEIRLHNRIYICRSRIDIFRAVRIIGTGVLSAPGVVGSSGTSTQLYFNNATGGFLAHYIGTYGPDALTTGALELRGVHLRGSGGASTHGIQIHNAANIEWSHISGFGGNGFHADCSTSYVPPTNGNRWKVSDTRIVGNTGHGMFIDGADANAGQATSVSVEDNGGSGIFDSSFLGNAYVMIHSANNAAAGAAYRTDDTNTRSVFLSCYSEGCATHDIRYPSIVVGGFMCPSATASSGFIYGTVTGLTSNREIGAANGLGANTITNRLGSQSTGQTAQELSHDGDSTVMRFQYQPSAPHTGFWIWRDSESASLAPLGFSAPTNVREGRGQVLAQNGIYHGGAGSVDPRSFIKVQNIGSMHVELYGIGTVWDITNATNATPIVVTVNTPHEYVVGQRVLITSVGGNTAANGIFTLSAVTADTFTLSGSVGNGTYTAATGTAHALRAEGFDLAIDTGPPGTGLWGIGDRIWNHVPAVGQPTYWVCTVAGSPGTWVAGPTL